MNKQTDISVKNSIATIFLSEDKYKYILNKCEIEAVNHIINGLDGIQKIYNKQSNLDFPGANLYPHDLSKEEFEIAARSDDRLLSQTALVVRDKSSLLSIPYSYAFKDILSSISSSISNAAGVCKGRFRDYLLVRSAELLTDDYYHGDNLWLDLNYSDSALDLIIGPFETYIDRFMGIKTSYEGTLSIRDVKTQQNLSKLIGFQDLFIENIPGGGEYKANHLLNSQLEVTNVIAFSGHSASHKMNAKVLPNDERVTTTRGTKKLLFRNIVEIRVDLIIEPIIVHAVSNPLEGLPLKEGIFYFLILHEISHPFGILPSTPKLDDLTSAVEEAKAHILAIHFAIVLEKKGHFSETQLSAIIKGFLGYLIADIRLGKALRTKAPYRDAAIIILSKMFRHGVFRIDHDGIQKITVCDLNNVIHVVNEILFLRNNTSYDDCSDQLISYRNNYLWDSLTSGMNEIPINI